MSAGHLWRKSHVQPTEARTRFACDRCKSTVLAHGEDLPDPEFKISVLLGVSVAPLENATCEEIVVIRLMTS